MVTEALAPSLIDLLPGACFSKSLETFQAQRQILKSKPVTNQSHFASSTDSFTVLFSKLLKLCSWMQIQQTKTAFRAWKVTGIFTKQAPWHEKNSVQTSANCLLWAQGKLPYVFVCVILRDINKNWIGPDRINPQIFPPNNRRLGIVFWGSIQSSPIQVLSTTHSERLIHKVKTFVERLLLVKICFYNKQHIHK